MQKEQEKEKIDTICALATSHAGIGAVAIIRVSGSKSFAVVEKFARKVDSNEFLLLKGTHRCKYGIFVNHENIPLDSVLFVYMHAPNSFTGEDVVEIQCHGGVIQSKIIIETLLNEGVRLARCGEFSQRAFLNQRLSLLQAEAVNNIVSATTRKGAKVALANSLGLTTDFIVKLRNQVKSLMALVEVQIDFPEDTDHLEDNTVEIVTAVTKVIFELQQYLGSFKRGLILRDGFTLVITGPVNSGKSSLFNALLKSDRAIVNCLPGTTRDTVSESILIDGWNFNILDTAGLRETDCSIELEGIRRSRIAANNADIEIRLYDMSVNGKAHSQKIMDENLSKTGISDGVIDNLQTAVLMVGNKYDLLTTKDKKEPSTFLNNRLCISALTGYGIEELASALVEKANTLTRINDSEGIVMTSLRQRNGTVTAIQFLKQAIYSLNESFLDKAADDLLNSIHSLESLIGLVSKNEVIDEIFANFCLGK